MKTFLQDFYGICTMLSHSPAYWDSTWYISIHLPHMLFINSLRDLEEIATTRPIYKGKSPHKKKKPDKPQAESVVYLDLSRFFRPFGYVNPSLRRVWFVKDICGIVCAVFTWLLILYAEGVVLFVIVLHESSSFGNYFHGSVFYCCSFLAFASHIRAMLTDPVRHWWNDEAWEYTVR